MMHEIQKGDKLYVITRHDIKPGYQAVQSCHALRQFVHEHPDVDREWFDKSNYIVLLSTSDENSLLTLLKQAKNQGLKCSAFHEPDVENQITAIAIEPHPNTSELCRHLPLALSSNQ